jgi:chromosome segregation ATPase
LEAEKSRLLVQTSQQEGQLKDRAAFIEKLNSELLQLGARNEMIQLDLEAKEQALSARLAQADMLKSSASLLKEKITDLEITEQNLLSKLADKDYKLQEKMLKIESLQKRNNNQREELKSTQAELESTIEQLQESESESRKLRSNLDKLQKDYSSLEADLNTAQADLRQADSDKFQLQASILRQSRISLP